MKVSIPKYRDMEPTYPIILFEVLACAYIYYHHDDNLMSDAEYDEKAKWLANQGKKETCHGMENKIKWRMFKKSTSLFYIKEHQYRNGFKQIALKWLNILKEERK